MRTLVIGAGVIGAAIAEELASRGAQVTVLDMRSPGRGATQASAGLLTPFIEARADPALLDLCTRSLALYDAFIDRVRERSGLPVQYERDGTLEVAIGEAERNTLADLQVWLGEQHVEHHWLDPKELLAFEPAVSPDASGGVFISGQGFVAATALVKALVQSARLQGATFESPAEIVRITPGTAAIDVRADDRRLSFDRVVVAAGTWSGRIRIDGAPPTPVRPIRGQLLQLTWAGGALPKRPVWGSRVYTVPWQPDTLLVGATVEDVGFDERTTVDGVRELLAGVAELLPLTRQSAIADIRVGLRPMTADHKPIISPLASDPRVWLATGHYRNGVLLAPLTAQIVAEAIVPGT
jgi:glycine oxidase